MKKALSDIDAHLRTRLRMIIWKQWKVPSKRQWGLQKLGVNKDLARLTSYCGNALTPKADYRLNKKETMDFVHFSCSSYKKHGKNACSSHRINARDLYNIVLEDIQYHGKMALPSREDFVLKIAEKIDKDKVDEKRDKIQKLNLDRDKLKDLDKAFEKLYEDRLNENITERNFNLMNDKLS